MHIIIHLNFTFELFLKAVKVSRYNLDCAEAITNQSKQIVWRAQLTAFDRNVEFSHIGDFNLGFPGQYWDAEKQSWYNYFRDYDGSTGRYLQSDPIGLEGGMNTYGYSLNNPLTLTDPTGEGPILAGFCGAGGAGVGALAYGLDCFGVASTASDVSSSGLIEKALGLEQQVSDLDSKIESCKDTSKKFLLIQQQSALSKQASALRRQAASTQVEKSFGGYLGVAGIGAVTFVAVCGSLPTP